MQTTITLKGEALKKLESLGACEPLSNEELVRRAIELYSFYQAEVIVGRNVLISRNPTTGCDETLNIIFR